MWTPHEAEEELALGARMNPGPWVQHSRSVARNARWIAEKCPGMDADAAFVVGLLHDIGRREGVTAIKHTLDGYDRMMSLGQQEAARVCLTHSFPFQDADTYFGECDVSDERRAFLRAFIRDAAYDDYDRLI